MIGYIQDPTNRGFAYHLMHFSERASERASEPSKLFFRDMLILYIYAVV